MGPQELELQVSVCLSHQCVCFNYARVLVQTSEDKAVKLALLPSLLGIWNSGRWNCSESVFICWAVSLDPASWFLNFLHTNEYNFQNQEICTHAKMGYIIFIAALDLFLRFSITFIYFSIIRRYNVAFIFRKLSIEECLVYNTFIFWNKWWISIDLNKTVALHTPTQTKQTVACMCYVHSF